jgi:STE24 endopeptidase
VSRFLLLFLFLIWLAWRAEGDAPPAMPRALDLALFFGLYLLLLGMLAAWARLLARRVRRAGRLDRAFRYFNRVVFIGRVFVPAWFAVGVFFLGWGDAVGHLLGPVSKWPVQLPGAILGTLPPLLAWMALSWAQYPAEYALRERSLLIHLDDGEPIFRPPSLWAYVLGNLRLQILFTAVPILLILLAHDVVMMILSHRFHLNLAGSATEGLVTFLSAVCVFLVVPEILTRVLPTEPLPASPLRDRMEAMAVANRLKFRDILLWRTQHRIANALVMGIVPRFRYVLLSDLLIDEMSDEQIEAVFAHEVGHVVHRHLIWYLVFMKVLLLGLAGVGVILEMGQPRYAIPLPHWLPVDLVMPMVGFGLFLVAFGFLSRRFERQADVFAARTLQRERAPQMPTPSHVGPVGASVFTSALERVAAINNMSVGTTRRWEGGLARRIGFILEFMSDAANNWLHGSIAQRMRTLQRMSEDPSHTRHFDRRMARLYLTLVVLMVVTDVVAWKTRVLM